MPDLLLASIEYGGYISVIKFIVFLILFFLWLPLLGWVHNDARVVGTREVFWTAVILGAGAAAAIIWLVTPLFIIGMLLWMIVVAATSISYVMHRNARVRDFERVLTIGHIKGLFVRQEKKLEAIKGFVFITANNNEVPMPEPQTADFFGYRKAYELFTDAIWRRASDIVLSPMQQNYNVTYYVDGVASKQPTTSAEQAEYLIHFLKSIADIDPNEKRKPQKGKFRIYKEKENIEWEVATAGSTTGEQLKLKQMTQEGARKLADIGLASEQYEQISKIRDTKQGLFIIAGPKKSGVTTTFYALLRNHDPYLYNVNTLERQPSGELPNVTQNVFALSDSGTTTFARKLQAVIRMEPDVVGVADCRDAETAQVACRAAKDGKTVYVTIEADNVIVALGKWLKLVGSRNLATETLLGISNQRLLRKLCTECRQAYEPNKELLRKFNIPPEKAKVFYRTGEAHYRRGKTCKNCQGTGFVGRMCVFEIITINDRLRSAIRQSKSLSEIGVQFRRAKMLYLQEQALRKVIDGATAINEMVRILSRPKKQKTKKPH